MADTPEWVGVVTATAIKYLKGQIRETVRNRVTLAMLESKGRIKYGQTGTEMRWNVQYDQHPMETFADDGQLTFERHDLMRQLSINWRGYKTTDKFTEKERLMNRGDVAIVNRYADAISNLMESFRARFAPELYIDGYATGNTNRICGLESFFGSGTTVAADRLAQPSDTYANKSTSLGNEGGTWSTDLSGATNIPNAAVATDWPDGSGDTAYDYLSPKLVNWSSTSWGTNSATTWEDNCERAIGQALSWTTSTGGKEGRPDLLLLNSRMHNQFKDRQRAKQRVEVPYKAAQDLGFDDVMNFDGIGITADFDVPSNTGYLMNFDKMELLCLYDQLFYPRGPEYDIKTDSYLMHIGFFGNCRFRPRHFAKLGKFA